MTNKEAIFVLKKELDGIPSDIDKSAFEKAINLAIKALEREENLEQALSTTEDNSAVDTYTEDDVQYAIKEGHQVGYGMAKAKFERPGGKWIPQTAYDGFTYWKCSECGKKNDFEITEFCFHCGADMRKGGAK